MWYNVTPRNYAFQGTLKTRYRNSKLEMTYQKEMVRHRIAWSFNGRTAVSKTANVGSTPAQAASFVAGVLVI